MVLSVRRPGNLLSQQILLAVSQGKRLLRGLGYCRQSRNLVVPLRRSLSIVRQLLKAGPTLCQTSVDGTKTRAGVTSGIIMSYISMAMSWLAVMWILSVPMQLRRTIRTLLELSMLVVWRTSQAYRFQNCQQKTHVLKHKKSHW